MCRGCKEEKFKNDSITTSVHLKYRPNGINIVNQSSPSEGLIIFSVLNLELKVLLNEWENKERSFKTEGKSE